MVYCLWTRGREKKASDDDKDDKSGWRSWWWCGSNYIMPRIIHLIFENLRNHFLYVMVELRNFAESHVFWKRFPISFQAEKLLLTKPSLRFYLIRISFIVLPVNLVHSSSSEGQCHALDRAQKDCSRPDLERSKLKDLE